jgi:hypothetical protein
VPLLPNLLPLQLLPLLLPNRLPLPKNKVLHLSYKPVSTDAGFLLAITDI